MTAMRAGYMILSGMTQAMGGSMSQAFSAMYGLIMGGIQTGSAIAGALAVSSPAGWLQAGMMMASLATAISQLGLVAAGQEDFARQIGGINIVLQSIGGLINNLGF